VPQVVALLDGSFVPQPVAQIVRAADKVNDVASFSTTREATISSAFGIDKEGARSTVCMEWTQTSFGPPQSAKLRARQFKPIKTIGTNRLFHEIGH